MSGYFLKRFVYFLVAVTNFITSVEHSMMIFLVLERNILFQSVCSRVFVCLRYAVGISKNFFHTAEFSIQRIFAVYRKKTNTRKFCFIFVFGLLLN